MDLATLGVKIISTGVDTAKKDLDGYVTSAKAAEGASGNLAKGALQAEAAVQKEAVAVNSTAGALRSLTSESSQSVGVHGAFANEVKKLSQTSAVAAHDLKNMSYQIIDVVQGLATGQRPLQIFAQQAGQIGQIAATSGVGIGGWAKAIGGLISPAILAGGVVLGLGAAALYVAAQMHKGAEEQIAFNNVIKLTGGYAATSATSLSSMADKMADTLSVTSQSVRDVEMQLVSTGRVGSASLAQLTEAAILYAKATGGEASDAVKVFTPLLGDTTTAALALNEQFHALTFAQLENIQSLQQQGDKQGAVKAAMDALLPSMRNQDQNLGILEKSWRGVGLMIASATDSLMNWGKASGGSDMDKADSKLAALIQKRDSLQGQLNNSGSLLGKISLYGTYGAGADAHQAGLRSQIEGINGQIRAYQALDQVVGQFNDEQKKNQDLEQNAAAITLSRQSQLTKLKSEEATLTKAIAAGVGNVASEQTALLAVQKEIANLNKPERAKVSTEQREYEAAVQSAQAYIAALREETAVLGLSNEAIKRHKAEMAAAAAPTKALADEIMRTYAALEHKTAVLDRDSPLDDPKLGKFKVREVEDGLKELPKLIHPLRDEFALLGEDISRSLGEAIAYGDDLGEAVSNAFKRMAAEYISSGIQSIFDTLIGQRGSGSTGTSGGVFDSVSKWAMNIGHNAAGTDNWRGGPTWVGERGPEIVNLPRGASVTPNHAIGGSSIIAPVVQIPVDGAGMLAPLFEYINAQTLAARDSAIATAERNTRNTFSANQTRLKKFGKA